MPISDRSGYKKIIFFNDKEYEYDIMIKSMGSGGLLTEGLLLNNRLCENGKHCSYIVLEVWYADRYR